MVEKMIDRKNLHDIFDMEPIENEIFEISKSITNDPLTSLNDNIDRANEILNLLENEMRNGNMSARIAEVAGQLINSITNASKEIISDKNTKISLLLKDKMLKLKELEINIKENKLKTSGSNNLLIADRETILKLLESKKDEEIKKIN